MVGPGEVAPPVQALLHSNLAAIQGYDLTYVVHRQATAHHTSKEVAALAVGADYDSPAVQILLEARLGRTDGAGGPVHQAHWPALGCRRQPPTQK